MEHQPGFQETGEQIGLQAKVFFIEKLAFACLPGRVASQSSDRHEKNARGRDLFRKDSVVGKRSEPNPRAKILVPRK
jgi:hypothetical protein